MQLQLQSPVSFTERYPFSSIQKRTAIINRLNRQNIIFKEGASEILTGKDISKHAKERLAESKTVEPLVAFKNDLIQALADFKNGKKEV